MQWLKMINFDFIKNYKIKFLIFIVLVSSLIALDLYTKKLAEKAFVLKNPVVPDNIDRYPERDRWQFYYQNSRKDFIKNFWGWRYVRNYDIGFSLFNFLDNYISTNAKKTFLKILQSLVVILALIYFISIKMKFFLPFSLIISGGLGNALNRIINGYVIDFIEWYIPAAPRGSILNPWPYFNLADSMAVIGVFMLAAVFISNSFEKKSNG